MNRKYKLELATDMQTDGRPRQDLCAPRRRAALMRQAVDLGLLTFFLLGVTYLTFKTIRLGGQAGYDFRYMWLAGKLWSQGVNPYSPEYKSLGAQLITTGHVPTLWPYPPNWGAPGLLLAQFDLIRSAFIFNILNVLALATSSMLLSAAFAPAAPAAASPKLSLLREALSKPRNVFFLHFGAMATLQAAALILAIGQTSIIIYLGMSLLVYGLAKEQRLLAALGLILLLLKPQVAAPLVVVLLIDRRWELLLQAAAASAAISLPALIVAPTAVFDWLGNLGLYDGINTANAPQAMTGARNLAWDVFGHDIGNMTALMFAIFATGALRLARPTLRTEAANSVQPIVLAAAVTIAFAPLHTYDLVIVGVLLPPIMQGQILSRALGFLGALLIWRADDLAHATGFYAPGAHHFPGSRIATWGGIFVLLAAIGALKRRPWQADARLAAAQG